MGTTVGNGSSKNNGNSEVSRGEPRPGGSGGNINLHAGKCSICGHAQREDIERDFLAWQSPKEIVKEYRLGNRAAVYRHAHAFRLMEKRYLNLRAALARIIERAGEVPVTAWSVVAAVRACAKINARGKWVEREEPNQMRDLLDGMTQEELLAYAEQGTLPQWFHGTDVAALPAEESADA